jgi:spoIIIJ-associated protein
LDSIIKAGDNIEAAVAAAAKDLGVSVEQVSYTVLEQGSRGFLGLGAKPAKVEVRLKPAAPAKPTAAAPVAAPSTSAPVKPPPPPKIPPLSARPSVPVEMGSSEEMAIEFVRELTKHMGLDVTIEAQKRDRHLYLNLTGQEMGILIGKRGQTLDALQYIVNLAIPRETGNDFGVVVDTENYRRRRRDTLESMARRTAKKVKETRSTVKMEPMSRFERHVIHTALQNDKTLRTTSEGNEPARYVVISPR